MNKKNPTPAEIEKKIDNMYKEMENITVSLFMRWQDEKEYEDIKDYGEAIKNKPHPDFIFVSMNKSPFGFKFKVKGFVEALYRIKLSGRSYGWDRVE